MVVPLEWRWRVAKGVGRVEAKSGVLVGVVVGLGKCERGWVKYEKGGESRVWGCEIFVKCFTLAFLVKYFASSYTQNFSRRKIFYNFDYILHAIKHLKMGKYFTKNILHWNKQSEHLHIFHCPDVYKYLPINLTVSQNPKIHDWIISNKQSSSPKGISFDNVSTKHTI